MGQSIKVSTQPAVVILPFHQDAFKIAQTGAKAAATMKQKMEALLTSRYGAPVIGQDDKGEETRSGGPTFEQYRADQKALAKIAKDRGLASDQSVRKPFAAAVRTLYGKLPEAQTPEAIRKAQERKVAQEAVAALRKAQEASKPGAVKGETSDRRPDEQEQVESLVARVGVFKCLDACIAILAADESTEAQAAHLRKMAAKAAEQMSKKVAA